MTHYEIIGYITVIFAIALHIPYLKQTITGSVKPHPFTWVLWTTLTIIVFFAQYVDGAGPGAWGTGVVGLLCIAITLASLRNGFAHIKKVDGYLFLGALLSIPLWLVTNDPTLSVILLTLIDLIAFAPTYRKSYMNPHDEPIYLYGLNVLRHGLSLFAIVNISIATTLFPFMVMLANGSLALFLLWRRRALAK